MKKAWENHQPKLQAESAVYIIPKIMKSKPNLVPDTFHSLILLTDKVSVDVFESLFRVNESLMEGSREYNQDGSHLFRVRSY